MVEKSVNPWQCIFLSSCCLDILSGSDGFDFYNLLQTKMQMDFPTPCQLLQFKHYGSIGKYLCGQAAVCSNVAVNVQVNV
jgi:hypothetical protein